ncbi:hypothetical protein [Coleofasciculus sp. H7-2]|uniref:hypothetical protein n=1 Tax=Coleofasciculus sp. H7-2 TaxID=3351545 RepID=UPI00366A89B9
MGSGRLQRCPGRAAPDFLYPLIIDLQDSSGWQLQTNTTSVSRTLKYPDAATDVQSGQRKNLSGSDRSTSNPLQ